ncbi:MAG: hypothetical protein IPF54_11410 [Draconibacterium sp.]|nr:hypothetical protein [Draconibacterium sp.]
MNKTQQFLKAHKLSAAELDLQSLTDDFISEMENGLAGKAGSLLMLPTYLGAEGTIKPNQPVVAIDAGGTNFRAVKMYFDDNLKLVTENLQQRKMPAIDEELSNKEFFATLAAYLTEYKNVSDKIGFCFSYAVEIYPNKDGKLLEWSKEVKAPEVIGQMVGKNLLQAMGTPKKQIVLMNDTVSTLLAGQAATAGKLTSEEVNKFVSCIDLKANILSEILVGPEDKEAATIIINAFIERAAKLVAASLAAVVLKTGKAKTADKPILMTIEGTTFYKMNNFRIMFEAFLQGFFSGKNRRFYEIVEVPNSSLIGAGIAAIVN